MDKETNPFDITDNMTPDHAVDSAFPPMGGGGNVSPKPQSEEAAMVEDLVATVLDDCIGDAPSPTTLATISAVPVPDSVSSVEGNDIARHKDSNARPTPAITKTEKKFKLDDFKLDQGADECVKMAYSTVTVGRANKNVFFYVNPDTAWRAVVSCLEHTEGMNKTYYLVSPEIAVNIPNEVRQRLIIPCATRDGAYFLWPVAYSEPGRHMDPWTFSAQQIICNFAGKWIRVIPSKSTNAYDCLLANNQPPSPEWPEGGMEWLVETAFQDRIIDSFDHEILRQLRGEDGL